MQLLTHLMHTGDAEALDLWHEWERGSKGKRMIGWSRGLRARFGVTETERTDEEVVQEQIGTVEDDRLRFTEDGWYRLCSHPERYADLQTIAEVEGVLAAAERCLAWGVEYSLV